METEQTISYRSVELPSMEAALRTLPAIENDGTRNRVSFALARWNPWAKFKHMRDVDDFYA